VQTVTITGGVVAVAQRVDFSGKGHVEAFDVVELRSPVRQGDQYTILDRRYTDTAIDADGDNKADALDVAVYARVIGIETITPPNLPSMQAVRVDTTVLSRVVYSSSGQPSPTVQATLQTWYVAGIGIVRQLGTTPNATGSATVTTDELITAWDAGTTGLGAMPAIPAVIPSSSTVYPGNSFPSSGLRAYAFADHALLVSMTPDIIGNALLATRVDLRGNVLDTTLLPGLDQSDTVWLRPAGPADGVVILHRVSFTGCNMTRLDSNGALIGSVDGISLNLQGGHVSEQVRDIAAATDGGTLWILWSRGYYDPGNGALPGVELVMRPYSLQDGTPLAAETRLDDGSTTGLLIDAANGQALMQWARVDTNDLKVASASAVGVLATRTIAQALGATPFARPIQTDSIRALLWSSPLGTNLGVGTVGGVKLDAGLTPQRAGATWLDEQIAGLPVWGLATPSAAGPHIVVTSTQEDSFTRTDSVSWLDVGSAALARTPVSTVRFDTVGPVAQAVFADRALIFGGSGGGRPTTTVVWLNKGAGM
jgi:hypothetical protein